MKIGYHIGYWSSGTPGWAPEAIRVVEDLGFDSVWTAEAYGSDCLTPLAWWGAATSRLRLGTNLMQLSARTPAATAMAAMTLDHLCGGRFVLGLGVSGPRTDDFYRAALAEGFTRPGARRRPEEFEVAASVPMVVDDDLERAADRIRPLLALYIGGMGARGANFHLDVFARMGWDAVCARVQDHYLAGRKGEAAGLVPTEMISDVALIGPPGRIREHVSRWEQTVVTTLLVQSVPFGGQDVVGLRAVAEALG